MYYLTCYQKAFGRFPQFNEYNKEAIMNTMFPENYKVCVVCNTYNHAAFIKDALNGFDKQKTDFPFLCVVVDDASTDGQVELICRYIERVGDIDNMHKEETDDYALIIVRHVRNINCFFAVYYLKYNHYRKKNKYPYFSKWINAAKFVALCEGDDYWTDPCKLQKQVNLLEANQDCVVCSAGFEIHHEYDSQIEDKTIYHGAYLRFNVKNYFTGWYMKTLTLLTYASAYKEYNETLSKYEHPKDSYFFYHLMKMGNGIYLCGNVGVYNRHPGGIWSSLDNRQKVINDYYACGEVYYKNNCDIDARLPYVNCIITLIRYPDNPFGVKLLIKECIKTGFTIRQFFSLIKSIGIYIYKCYFNG